MDSAKTSKKDLKKLLSDAFTNSLHGLELPEPNKKIIKLIDRQAKEVASVYVDLMRKSEKKQKKAEKMMKKALTHENGRRKKKTKTEARPEPSKA